ncbi:hypothetical protein R5W23_000381 [Gemmata sp. JC673]|uniref:Transmembrane protein n=1 Tax=Gemmata algarum TaxID=2975278 RepID=A0ABU5EVX8_9BACT|nr:hypothetical protein [Gemmata algarum]MDY3559389.1 hypothetical protein [Gemmata algarum]
MSVGTVGTVPLKLKAAALFALAVLSGFAHGPFSTVGTASAQPTNSSNASGQTKGNGEKEKPSEADLNPLDRRDPVPADSPRRKGYDQLRIPDTDRTIFAEIADFKPVAAQDKNPREYDAWIEYVLHARKQNTHDLNEHGIRDLVPLEFAKFPRAYRTELVRFDGKLSCVRRLVPPPQLRSSGVSALYEARLVPLDESPATPVSFVFTDLPESLAAVSGKAPEEWLDADGWVTATGYFFKTMSVAGEQGSAVVNLPLLIGKGLTPLPGPPPGSPTPTALDKSLRLYKFIQDDVKMTRARPTAATWAEVAAYNRVVLHAARFSAEELERDAVTDVRFADLFEEPRIGHRLSLVKFEGRLISLRRMDSNDWLGAAGVTQLFEGWLIPDHEQRGNPVCVVFSEPLDGVDPARRVNKWVTFAGYSFKRMRYESAEEDAKNPSKHIDKLAPLLIGKKPIGRQDPEQATPVTWNAFGEGTIIGAALLILCAGVFALWYRHGDRQARAEMDAVRGRNPFDPPA